MRVLLIATVGAALLLPNASYSSDKKADVLFGAFHCRMIERQAERTWSGIALNWDYYEKEIGNKNREIRKAALNNLRAGNKAVIGLARIASVYNAFCKP